MRARAGDADCITMRNELWMDKTDFFCEYCKEELKNKQVWEGGINIGGQWLVSGNNGQWGQWWLVIGNKGHWSSMIGQWGQ